MKRKINTHNLPFKPSKWPFFYGWFIIFAAMVGTVASVPGQTFGVSAFTEHIIDALDINRTLLSAAYLFGTIGSAFLLTWGGKLYDKVGARLTALAAASGLGLILLYLSGIDTVSAKLGAVFGEDIKPWTTFAAITFGFLLLRFCGQGMLTMTSRNMLMKWFDHRRGLANGIMGSVVALTFSGTPFVFDAAISSFGWQASWMLMGIIVLGIICTFIIIFFRDNPEACDLLPDNGKGAKPGDPKHDPDQDYTLPQARKTPAFWVYNLSVAIHALYFTAFTFHIVSIFEQVGIGKTKAFAIFIPASAIAVVARITSGWISDHIPLRLILFTFMTGVAISMGGVMLLATPVGYYMIILGNGIAGAVFGLLSTITWPRLFGRTHLGAISGFHMSWVVAFSALGPFLFGLSLKYLDSYLTAIAACLGVLFILFLRALKLEA